MFELDLVTKLETIAPSVYAMQAPDEFNLPLIIYTITNTAPIRDFGSSFLAAILTVEIDIYNLDYWAGKAMMRDVCTMISEWTTARPVLENIRDDIDKTTPTPIYRSSVIVHLYDPGN